MTVMKTSEDFTIEFPPGFDFVAQDIDRFGIWETRTTEFVKNNLKPGQTFLDVGAQVGYYSILAEKMGAKTYAFEPSMTNMAYLQKNLVANDCHNVSMMKFALADKPGEVKLYTGKTPGENSLTGNGEFELVQATRYDDLDLDIPDMVKIDVEGAEQSVLMGMQKVLNASKTVYLIIEDWYNHVTDWLIDEYGFELITTERAFGNRILVKNKPIVPALGPSGREPLRIHLLGTFNTPTTLKDEGIANAFASKVVRMAKILKRLGHYVIFYGVEGSEVECDEFVQVSTKEILRQTYGEWKPEKVYGCQRGDLAHTTFNRNCIEEINKRRLFGDFLLCCFGNYQQEIAAGSNIADIVEIGIGYTGSFARFRIFESHFMQNWTYGAEGKGDGNFYDTVIPGCFDPEDFETQVAKDGTYLYLGRVIKRKGVFIAQQVCEKIGAKLVVAGFGYDKTESGVDAHTFRELLKKPNVEYVGFAGLQKRAELMAKATAVFMPTTYLEPFGYVAIEAMMSGTPAITTDFGAFPETINHGVSGFRCKSFAEFVKAAKNADKLNPDDCRKWAIDNFSLENTIPKYDNYFDHILNLYGKGWYA